MTQKNIIIRHLVIEAAKGTMIFLIHKHEKLDNIMWETMKISSPGRIIMIDQSKIVIPFYKGFANPLGG
jgi:hypothetical protein